MMGKVLTNDAGYIFYRGNSGSPDRPISTIGESGHPITSGGFHADSVVGQAMSEFYLARHSEKTGAWRWPEHPEFILKEGPASDYDDERTVYVFNEETFTLDWKNERVLRPGYDGELAQRAARAFLLAHPIEEPSLADQAKPWDTFLVEYDGVEQIVTIDEDREFRDRVGGWMHIANDSVKIIRKIEIGDLK